MISGSQEAICQSAKNLTRGASATPGNIADCNRLFFVAVSLNFILLWRCTMQIVSMKCSQCGKEITFASEGLGCERCERAYHATCIEAGKVCPSCGEDLEHQRATAVQREK